MLEEAEAALEKAKDAKSREVAKAKVDLDASQLELDKVEERRERNLLARKAASQEDYDRATAQGQKSAAQVESAKAELHQSTADYEINILSAQAKVDQARADLEAAQIDLGYCRMFAPIDGRTGELQVKLGNLVGPAAGSSDTTSLVSIQQLDPMGVDLRPASRYLPLIAKLVKSGLEVSLRVQGQAPIPTRGRSSSWITRSTRTTSTVLVKAEVPNPEQVLLPGEYVMVDLNLGDYAGAVVVPDEAVVEAQEGSRVQVVDDQNKVQVTVVKPLDTYQGLVVLETGLNEGRGSSSRASSSPAPGRPSRPRRPTWRRSSGPRPAPSLPTP